MTFCFDDLVDSVQPGDKVEVTGVLRAQPVRVHPKIRRVKTVYKTYVDVVHFRTVTGMSHRNSNNAGVGDAAETVHAFTPERIDQLKALSQQPDIYEQLTASLAPSIWELDNVKKGILCMLFGGNSVRVKQRRRQQQQDEDAWLDEEDDDNDNASTAKLNKRGDINILLCGDPGTSKSQLSQLCTQAQCPWSLHLRQGQFRGRSDRFGGARPRNP